MKLQQLINKYLQAQKQYWRQLQRQRRLHQVDANLEGLYEKLHSNAQPIFVLSTGRAGTMLLTRLFEKSKHLMPAHEPVPELAYHSRLAYARPIGSSELKMAIDMARYEYIRDAHLLNLRYVETNNRITFFAYYLAQLYPQAKFVHLIRHPYDFIRSGLARGWYKGTSIYDEGRVSDTALFKNFSQQEKIAWLWTATNGFITQFNQANPSRCVSLRSEDLFASERKAIQSLFDFLEIGDISDSQISSAIRKVENKGKPTFEELEWAKLSNVTHFTELADNFNYS